MRNSSGVVFLIAGGNWNNGTKAGVTYLNSNNVASNSNRNISSQLELRTFRTERTALNSILTCTQLP
jgi:hypothetical protein